MPDRRNAAAAVFVAAVLVASCTRRSDDGGASSGGVDAGAFDKAALLRAAGECALGGYRDFQAAAAELEAAAGRASSEATPAAIEAAREAWRKAIDAWQRVEVLGFGPAATATAPGGQDMRDPIYAWPLFSRCATEQMLVDQLYAKPAFASALVTTRGLAAAEYLLFYEPSDNACAPDVSINASGAWAALGDAEIKRRKLAYARAVAADVAQRARALADAWDPAKGNFVGELASAGKGSKVFSSQHAALNALSSALFYADAEIKDLKVGKPAGLVAGCAAPPCLSDVESPWAKRSKEHLRSNLAALDRIVRGCGPGGGDLGFDDLLRAAGAPGVADDLAAQLSAVRAALDALVEPTFEDDIVKDAAGVRRLFDALRHFAAVLKGELLTVLALELPKRVEGDND